MSYIVKGRSIPEDCRTCAFECYQTMIGRTYCGATGETIARDFKIQPFEGRAPLCPLEEYKEPKKGRWTLKKNVFGVAYCSECDYELHTNNTNFCPNCGADMREEEQE